MFLKTAKSKLADILESESGNPHVDKIDIPNDNAALVVDAMAFVQCLKGNWKTFGDFADLVFEFVIKLAQDCRAKRLDFVADRYPALSIKNTERARRATQVQRVHIYGQEQKIPKQWKKFLSSGENKESLLEFFIKHWTSYRSLQFGSVSVLCTTSKNKCYIYHPSQNEDDPVRTDLFPVLDSNHEEADTRLLLHAKHAASTPMFWFFALLCSI